MQMMLPVFWLPIITTVVESGTGVYYGYEYCQQQDEQYNLTWYPLMDITVNTSNTNSEYQYIYSPCNLSFYSSELDQHFAMKRYDLNTGQEQYLIPAFTDGLVQQEDENSWKFEYIYPNISCPNQVQTVQIIWQCNSSISNFPDYYQTISAGPLYDCFDSLFIRSPFACYGISGQYQPGCTFSSNGKTLDLYQYPVDDYYYIWAACHNRILDHGYGDYNYATLYIANSFDYDKVYSTWSLSRGIDVYLYDPAKNLWNFTLFGYNITRQIDSFSKPYHCDEFRTYITYGCNCDPSNEMHTNRIEPDQECYMTINVTQYDLCINYINQCYPHRNNTDCVYYYRDDESSPYDKLDLTNLTNDEIVYVEDSGLYALHYTPCNNNFYCNNISNSSISIYSMAGRRAINSNKCVDPLAIFNGTDSFNVTHEMGTTTWIIEYFNGECPTNKSDTLRFRTTWEDGYTEWEVGSVDFKKTECLYDVTIYTMYADQ